MTLFEEEAQILVSRNNILLAGVLLQLLKCHKLQQMRTIVVYNQFCNDLVMAQLILQLKALEEYEAELHQRYPAARADRTGEPGMNIPSLIGEDERFNVIELSTFYDPKKKCPYLKTLKTHKHYFFILCSEMKCAMKDQRARKWECKYLDDLSYLLMTQIYELIDVEEHFL